MRTACMHTAVDKRKRIFLEKLNALASPLRYLLYSYTCVLYILPEIYRSTVKTNKNIISAMV